MNSRDRVLAAFNHEETERVRLTSPATVIRYFRYSLREAPDYLGLDRKPIRVYDIQQQLAIVDDDVLDRFDVDTIELGRAFALDDADWADWTLQMVHHASACLDLA